MEEDVWECARLRLLGPNTSMFSLAQLAAGAVLGRGISECTTGCVLLHGE